MTAVTDIQSLGRRHCFWIILCLPSVTESSLCSALPYSKRFQFISRLYRGRSHGSTSVPLYLRLPRAAGCVRSPYNYVITYLKSSLPVGTRFHFYRSVVYAIRVVHWTTLGFFFHLLQTTFYIKCQNTAWDSYTNYNTI